MLMLLCMYILLYYIQCLDYVNVKLMPDYCNDEYDDVDNRVLCVCSKVGQQAVVAKLQKFNSNGTC